MKTKSIAHATWRCWPACVLQPADLQAQAWPQKPIMFVVPFAPAAAPTPSRARSPRSSTASSASAC